ncbi:MAG: twin-arginine translocase subunit TatC [Candidatus Eremiobacteraeota bacterium]|nr:twin-arginine translocase subunit TatC [Candidatus Eremiobacteraeota bacterium]
MSLTPPDQDGGAVVMRGRKADEAEMTFTEHLRELRNRLFIAIAAVGLLSLIAFPEMPKILGFVEHRFLPGVSLHVFSPAEIIRVELKLSVLVGLVIAFPVVLYEAYAFVAPALDTRIRSRIVWYGLCSFVMSALGISFCGFWVLPYVIRALLKFTANAGLVGTYQLDPTVGFITILLGIFAVIFQLPIILSMLASVGLVSASFLLGKWRQATVLFCVVAGIAAPDGSPLTMALLALPLIALYAISIIVVRLTQPKVAPLHARSDPGIG